MLRLSSSQRVIGTPLHPRLTQAPAHATDASAQKFDSAPVPGKLKTHGQCGTWVACSRTSCNWDADEVFTNPFGHPTREHIDHLLVNSGAGRKSTNRRGGNPDNPNDFREEENRRILKLHIMLLNTYRRPSSFTPRHSGAVVVAADSNISQSAYRPKENISIASM